MIWFLVLLVLLDIDICGIAFIVCIGKIMHNEKKLFAQEVRRFEQVCKELDKLFAKCVVCKDCPHCSNCQLGALYKAYNDFKG